jgi:hypothetical protein
MEEPAKNWRLMVGVLTWFFDLFKPHLRVKNQFYDFQEPLVKGSLIFENDQARVLIKNTLPLTPSSL